MNFSIPYGPEEAGIARVQQLLAVGRLDEAWQAAQTEGCSDKLWLKLAARRTPAAALPVFQWQTTRLLERKDGYAAQEADKRLRVVRRVLRRLGRTEEFDDDGAALLARSGRHGAGGGCRGSACLDRPARPLSCSGWVAFVSFGEAAR